MRTGSPLSGRQAMVGVAHYKSYLRCDVCCYSKINFTYTIYRLFKYNTYIYIYYDILRYIYMYTIYIYIYTSGPYCIFQRGPTSFWSLESCFFPILLCRRTPCCSSQWKGPRQLPRMWDDPWVIETYIYIYPYWSKHCLRRYLTLQIIVNYTPNTS